MSLEAKFTFDRAGQGLFYHGQIRSAGQSFTVVYDCGTHNRKVARENLSKVVDDFNSNNNGHIGLLAISHFDLDHVSHIPELLRRNKVDTVMLPHIADDLRVVLFAKSIPKDRRGDSTYLESDLARLFIDPAGYFVEMDRTRQIKIIGIQADDDGSDSDSINNTPAEPNRGESQEGRLGLQYVDGGRYLHEESNPTKQYSAYSGVPRYRLEINGLSWLFRPLNIQEKLDDTFYAAVKEIRTRYRGDWYNLLSNANAIKELTKLYDNYIDKRRRNVHSLLLRHGPDQCSSLMSKIFKNHKDNKGWFFKRCFIHDAQRYLHLEECCLNHKECCRSHWDERPTTVLLGDLGLDDEKAKASLDQHRFLDKKTDVVLIPHHGASSDDLLWLDEKIENACATLVVSYGSENTYKHPSFIHDGTIAGVTKSIGFTNEMYKYEYNICFFRPEEFKEND